MQPRGLVKACEPRESRLCETPGNLAFAFGGVVLVERGGCDIVRDFSPAQFVGDGASRERMVKESILDPQSREDAIADPGEVARLREGGVDFIPREPRPNKKVLRLALRERAAEGQSEGR